jgi:predicted alpha/beta-fold hydrolase
MNVARRATMILAPALACEPPFWARGPHGQTLAGKFLGSGELDLPWERFRIPLDDGDSLTARTLTGGSGVLVALFHGLAGSVDGGYMRRAAARFHAMGHSVLAVNHRGAGEGQGLAVKAYNSGSTRDLAAALAFGRERFPGAFQVALGYSISANILLLLLGRDQALGLPDAAIAVNPPADLEACSRRLVQGWNRMYDQYFVLRLRKELAARPGSAPLAPTPTLREFDAVFTAPQGGFASRAAYYAECSCGPHLGGIGTPTVIISADDDPFAPAADIRRWPLPAPVHLHAEAVGGHMGFVSRNLADRRWLDYALDHYLGQLLSAAGTATA